MAAAYQTAATTATTLAESDPASARLVSAQLAAEDQARRLATTGQLPAATAADGPLARARGLATQLQTRQLIREAAARKQARDDSRRALVLIIVAGVLALAGALALITVLVRSMRRPLDELVDATHSLAEGKLERRVHPSGPRELQDLGGAFNQMGEDLATAQHRIEEERRRLAVTIESLGDALIVTEPGSSRIATVNPRAADLVPELVVGGQVDGEDSPLPPEQSALRREMLIDHGGRSLAVTAAKLGSADAGIVWTVRDMSERARLERAKSEFVATASHELRSPLTSIKGFVELLQRSPESMSDRQREFVDIILKSTDRLVELVNDLLDVARIEADHVEINRRPIDVGEVVAEVVELMEPRMLDKHQQLSSYVAPTLPPALADPGRVRQIVANLLTNAHLYTPEGGNIHVGVEPDRAWVQIIVADSGVGMNDEEISRVFDRFYRAGNRSGSNPGTGLGLSIVKSLVDLHYGQITIESEPGRGSAFRVLLPAAVPGLDSAGALESIRGRNVLVVDDEPEIAELIVSQLAVLDVQSTIAISGEDALERLRTDHYDAVTLDILMPGMDGFEVLRQIRVRPRAGDHADRVRVGVLRPPGACRRVGRGQTDRRRRAARGTRRGGQRRPLARAGRRPRGAPDHARARARRSRHRVPVGSDGSRGRARLPRAPVRGRARRRRDPQSADGHPGARPARPPRPSRGDPDLGRRDADAGGRRQARHGGRSGRIRCKRGACRTPWRALVLTVSG